jgi:SAM-dependent methyltransferase
MEVTVMDPREGAEAGSAFAQSALWGERAEDWAAVQEACSEPLYRDVLERVGIGAGVALLDAGCGAGMFCVLATERGAAVAGLDATPPLLAVARRRAPAADLREGDLEALPFPGGAFDVVTGFNSFQYAADPLRALREARRVARRGATVVVATWGRPDRCEAAAYLAALKPLVPPPKPGAGGPFALSDETALRALVSGAGLEPRSVHDVACVFAYADRATALRGLLSAGPPVAAIRHSGETAVIEAVTRAIEPFTSRTGAVRLENEFRYLVAKA